MAQTNSDAVVDVSLLKTSYSLIRAVHHSLRKEIIDLLDSHTSLSVTELYVKLRTEQSVTSQHLGILRKAGVVKTSRKGKLIYYSLNKERIQKVSEMITELEKIK